MIAFNIDLISNKSVREGFPLFCFGLSNHCLYVVKYHSQSRIYSFYMLWFVKCIKLTKGKDSMISCIINGFDRGQRRF